MRQDSPGSLIAQPNRDPRIAVGIIYPTGSIYITNRTEYQSLPLVNPGFESGNLIGWNFSAGGSIQSSGGGYQSTYYLSVPNGSGGPNHIGVRMDAPPVGSIMRLRAMARRDESSLPSTAQSIAARFYDSSDVQIGIRFLAASASTSVSGWQEISGTVTVPASARYWRFDFGEGTGTGAFHWDSASADRYIGIANVPGNVVHGCLKDLSASSQELHPDQGRSTIGSLSFTAVDLDNEITDEIRTQLLTNDRGLCRREVRVITGDTDDFADWQDQRVDTYVVDGVVRSGRSYVFSCSDRTREQRVSIFEQQKTRLSATITATATTISVLSTSGFEMLAHTAAFTDSPSATVGYFRIRQTGEVARYTGKTSTSFTGCTRGVLNTVAQPVTVEATDDDRKPEVEEVIYLEMPGPEMLHAIQTGVILSSSATLPPRWHMDMDEAYVDGNGYEAIGTDLYDPANPAAGFVLRFLHLKKEDGKKFVEEQIHIPMGTYPTVNTFGVLGIRRIVSLVSASSPQFVLNEASVIGHGNVQHSLSRVINRIIINWNFDGEDFTRANVFLNNNSIDVHGASKPLTLNLRGLHVSNHSQATIQRIANYFFERYGAPPIEGEISVSRVLNRVEIGDVGQIALPRIQDFAGASYLNRAIEVQGRHVNWKTGRVSLRYFASTARTVPDAGGGTVAVLPDGYYTGTGTNLTSVLTIVGNAVTTNGTITGGSDARTAVFYYNGNLTINAGVTVTITGNVQLRIKGTLTVNGTIDGLGNGLAGLTDPNSVSAAMINSTDQVSGFIGAARGSAGMRFRQAYVDSIDPPISRGINSSVPRLSIAVEAGALVGLPSELRGAPGGWGGEVFVLQNNGTTTVLALGGDGGDGGAGLLLICRGLAFGVSGEIDLSGAPGSVGGTYVGAPVTWNAGGGGGGAPGAFYVLLDGDNVTYPDLSSSFIANQGATTQTGTPMTEPVMTSAGLAALGLNRTGMNLGTPVEDRWEANNQIHYVPSDIELGESDDEIVPAPTGLTATGDVFSGVILSWSSPPAALHDYVEVWEATTNDRTGAVLLSARKASSLFVSKASAVTRYYWIRAVKQSGGSSSGVSAWHPSGSTSGVPATYGSLQAVGWIPDANGKPAGVRGVDDIANRSQLSLENGWLRIVATPDSVVGYGLPAVPIDEDEEYRFVIKHRSSGSSADGLFVAMFELNHDLPAGKTHAGTASTGEAMVESYDSNVLFIADGPMPGTTPVVQTFTYAPTAGTKHASVVFLVNNPATLVDYEVAWVALTILGSNVDLLPGVRSPGATEDLLPEAATSIFSAFDAGPVTRSN